MMRSIARAIGSTLPTIVRDLLGLIAAGSISYGAWLIYVPAGFIVGGVLVLAGVLMSARAGA